MSYYNHLRPSSASDASSSSSISHQDHIHSSATSSTSPHAFALPDDSDDLSFSSQHVVTSTPRKTRRRRRSREEEEREGEEDLRLSDTESLDMLDDEAIEKGLQTYEARQQHARLTRRSLATHLQEGDLVQPYSNSLTPRGIALPQGKYIRGELYAPSPSTGSSTLVEREEEGFVKVRDTETTAGRGARRVDRTVMEEEGEEDQRTEMPLSSSNRDQEEGSSSSPRPQRRSKVGDLANYIDARLSVSAPSSSTPRRSPKSRSRLASSTLPPQTPHAPGAFPSSSRKVRQSSPTPPPASETPVRPAATRPKTPPSSSSAQIHDAFARLITGPNGALSNSAERRIAMQSTSTPAQGSKREQELETPDFAGRYSFTPSSALPFERRQDHVQYLGEAQDEAAKPTKLETALRRVGKEESEFVQRRRQELRRSESRESMRELRQGRNRLEEEGEGEEEEAEANRISQRSAIDFAMARSFVDRTAEGERIEEEESAEDRPVHELRSRRSGDLRSSVRFAEPAESRSRTPSPPPRPPYQAEETLPSPHRHSRKASTATRTPPRVLSPDLPPLPPLLAPDSPEPARNPPPSSSFRRSQPTTRTRSTLRDHIVPSPPPSPPKQPIFEPPQPRSPSPPPCRAQNDPPKSSTPPRRTVNPPNPDATPPRASPSPLARRIRSSPPRETNSHSLQPTELGSRTVSPTPPNPPIDEPEEGNLSIPLLVNQLSAAVKALTAAHSSVPVQSSISSSRAAQPENETSFARELASRKLERERNRQAMEEELLELEVRGRGDDVSCCPAHS